MRNTLVRYSFLLVLFSGSSLRAQNQNLQRPLGVAVDSLRDLFVANTGSNRILENGTVVAGDGARCPASTDTCGDGGLAVNAEFNRPSSIALDSAGDIYIADSGDNRIRVVNTQSTVINAFGIAIAPGSIGRVVGTGVPCPRPGEPCGDGGLAVYAELHGPQSIVFDLSGNMYIADTLDNRIRIVNKGTGIIVTAER